MKTSTAITRKIANARNKKEIKLKADRQVHEMKLILQQDKMKKLNFMRKLVKFNEKEILDTVVKLHGC